MILQEIVYAYTYDETATVAWSWQQIQRIQYLYDQNGSPIGMRLRNNAGVETTYYYRKNLHGDILGVITADGYEVVTYYQ